MHSHMHTCQGAVVLKLHISFLVKIGINLSPFNDIAKKPSNPTRVLNQVMAQALQDPSLSLPVVP